MKSKVYYGEYSVSHWINLIISKNIILPEYQRIFVWSKTDVTNLINSIKNKEFIPPITIGIFNDDRKKVNYILDGQQRLTSLLLAMFKVFPKKIENTNHIIRLMNENDDVLSGDDLANNSFQWTFEDLTKLGDSYSEIKEKIDRELYDGFDLGLPTTFYYDNYIGFSYIVPELDGLKEQQKFFASIFRNINIKGTELSAMESRESLYFLDKDKTNFFKPDLSAYKISNMTETTDLDFVRYMALLSQYNKDGRESKIAVGYGNRKKIEDYYEEYIYSIVGERESSIFSKFTDIFPNNDYSDRINRLKQTMNDIGIPHTFSSIIDVDVYLFGLLYVVIIENKSIDTSKTDELNANLQVKIEDYKQDESHKKSPASLKYLRKRIGESIRIYSCYVENNQA